MLNEAQKKELTALIFARNQIVRYRQNYPTILNGLNTAIEVLQTVCSAQKSTSNMVEGHVWGKMNDHFNSGVKVCIDCGTIREKVT